jgi:aspartate dehydrogenase
MFELAIVGFGAIGQELARNLAKDPIARISQIIVPPASLETTRAVSASLAPAARVLSCLDLDASARPGLVAECAGHSAVLQHVVPALRAGVPCVVASVGALHEAGRLEALEEAARQGRSRVRLIAGAVGGLDALAAACGENLSQVRYTGRKPPAGWIGTPAEQVCPLGSLREAAVIFRGSAREAARQFPKNANVAAAVALAGLGLDATEVELIADPAVTRNVHAIEANGSFGSLSLRLENLPLPANPKTSALAMLSLLRAVRNTWAPLGF